MGTDLFILLLPPAFASFYLRRLKKVIILMGKGLGYIDIHLLASAMLSDVQLWTLDKRLNNIAEKILP